MQMPKIWVIGSAVLAAFVFGLASLSLLDPERPLIVRAEFSETRISPNADGQTDIAEFRYELSANAEISLVFTDSEGKDYLFRQDKSRVAGKYAVLFSGVVSGFQLEGESWEGTLETRLLPDGLYTWTLSAVNDDETMTQTGTLEIAEGGHELPLITAFDVGPLVFSPNQDGIRDRINVNIYLQKAATLTVFLEDENGARTYLSERKGRRAAGEAGNHEFDYDGGVDQGFRPPPNGTYTLFAVAQDAEGQRMVRTAQITLEDSGLPQVEIIPQVTGGTVCFEVAAYQEAYYSDSEGIGETIPKPQGVCSELSTLTIPLGDVLVFRLTVSNYGDTPIRTGPPFSGTVYQQDQRASSLGAYEQSGAWRLGIMCDTAESDFPWRWSLAPLDELSQVEDPQTGNIYYYLEPGQRAETWGAIRMTNLINARNPQPCWAGLIHEDVGIPAQQNNVGRREVELVPR